MAPSSSTPSYSLPLILRLLLCATLAFLCLLKKGYAINEEEHRETTTGGRSHNFHVLQTSSLFPPTACNLSTRGHGRGSSLTVVHKHGPCAQLGRVHSPSPTQILAHDQSRVDSLHSRLSDALAEPGKVRDSKVTLPAKSGSVVGSGNYIVTIGIGTPKKDLSLIFDTGSGLTWTQCKPCVRSCYAQKEPIYDPTASSSYSNITCNSVQCALLVSGTGNQPSCSGSTCVYGIQYGDQSFSAGFFAKDRLTLTQTDGFDGFLFGCGQNNQGLFGGSAGLIGLGRDQVSLVSQTAKKYGRVFSYCLPSSSGSTGFLTFGKSGSPTRATKYTPLVTSASSQAASFYFLDLNAISVAGMKLAVPVASFSAGTIIDSGTVITRLPPDAYAALRTAFRRAMARYPAAPALSILDTCYDLSGYRAVAVPKISLFFGGGTEVAVDSSGVFYAASPSQVCLAFAGNKDASDATIFGNVQQQTLEVVYDIALGRVGFAAGGCS